LKRLFSAIVRISFIICSNLKIYLFSNAKDTIRTIKDSYSKEINQQSFIHILNIIDRNELACRLINYLRNSFRLISAYIIGFSIKLLFFLLHSFLISNLLLKINQVAFTIQRLFIVYKPLSNNFKSKKVFIFWFIRQIEVN